MKPTRNGKAQGRDHMATKVDQAITVLRGVRLRVVELADVIEVSTGTVYRILTEIRNRKLPLRSKRRGREVRYWLHRRIPRKKPHKTQE